ncbi:hypothetical protein CP533_6726 [Ophiocordyceps camponoti-saundersi (nom. inval.)]|nr:hypothetical protein CP533_6726 [Ophiocordyceps camponoti-saundersi (nom. inval.)]
MKLPPPLFLVYSLAGTGLASTTDCKIFPGDEDWPSERVWTTLNRTLNGRLLTSDPPPGAACHTQSTITETCAKLKMDWTSYQWHSEDAVSVMWDQFTNYSCLPDPRFPCSSQGYPPYVINASTADHVKAGIDFGNVHVTHTLSCRTATNQEPSAKKHRIRLVVKNTGHDFIGRSIGPGALSIWTRHLNDIEYHADHFDLDCPDNQKMTIRGNAMTVGAGVHMFDAYRVADRHQQTLVGGGGKSVGFGGYISGGGHSYLSPHFGLAVDNVLQIEVVTPSGDILTVNQFHHPDLFWALRGGGGSTFGVITKVTMSTHPEVRVSHVRWIVATDPKAAHLWDLIAYVVSKLPYLSDSGLSGANFISKSALDRASAPGLPPGMAGVTGGSNTMLNLDDPNTVNTIFKPINDTLNARWPGKATLYLQSTDYPSFLAWFNVHYDGTTGGISRYIVSRLLDKEALTSDPKAIREALQAANEPKGIQALFTVAGKGVHEAKPRGGNAVHPAWRRAYVHAGAFAAEFPPLNKTAEREVINILDKSYQPLRDLTPDSGAYINEVWILSFMLLDATYRYPNDALPFERDWQHTFWGSNYERLLAIKKAVDPDDVFWCTPCIGSEGWQKRQDGRLCRAQ